VSSDGDSTRYSHTSATVCDVASKRRLLPTSRAASVAVAKLRSPPPLMFTDASPATYRPTV